MRETALSVLKQQYEEYKVYRKQGYGGLLAYQKEKLISSGIDPSYLNMTPQQLADFQKAKQVSQNALLPNFMTEYDIAEHNKYMQNWNAGEQEKYNQWATQNWIEDDNGNRVDLRDLYNISNVQTLYNDNGEDVKYRSDKFYNDEMGNLGLDNFSQQTAIASEKLANFGAVIENLSLTPDKNPTQYYSDSKQLQQTQPVTNNVTVQINEAHAWDTEHIQELSDKVADVITPAIEQALGGNSNSY